MRFEWDAEKKLRNIAKHKISFETAHLVFDDLHALSFQDRIVAGEPRWQTFGKVGNTLVMVAHASWDEDSEEVIRIISARRANAYERSVYEAHKKST